MKNKKLIYVLLTAVVALWGIIFYRIFVSVADHSPGGATLPPLASAKTDTVSSAPAAYVLLANYRDPFLGTMAKTAQPEKQRATEEASPETYIDWSFIHYLGVIVNPQTQKRITLVNINGQDRMMEEGTSIEGVKLIRNYGDSISISFNGTRTYIKTGSI